MDTFLRKSSSAKHTYLGIGALFIWAVEPLLVSEIKTLPIFELLTIVFMSSFSVTAIKLTISRKWSTVKNHYPWIWIAGLVGVCGGDFAYIYGAQFAPIAHVDLIDYLWPCVAVVFTGFLPNERFSWQKIIGSSIALFGIYILVAGDGGLDNISYEFAVGYLLAFGGAIVWGCYSVFSRYYASLPIEMVGLYCGIGAMISLVLHLSMETFVMPSSHEWMMAIITGATGGGIAYQLWDAGVKRGDIYLLSSLTYVGRLIGMILLVCFGKEALTQNLVLACLTTSLGILFSNINLSSVKLKGLLKKLVAPIFLAKAQ